MAALARSIRQSLPNPNMFEADDRAFYAAALKNQGSILLALARPKHGGRETIAGASVILFPDAYDPENLGFDLDFDRRQRSLVRQLDSVFLDPAYRGCGLSAQLMRKNMERTARPDRPYDMATIWPGNLPSLRLFFSLGLTLRALKLKYGGKPRFIALGGDGLILRTRGSMEISAWDMGMANELFSGGYAGTAARLDEITGEMLIRCQQADHPAKAAGSLTQHADTI